MIFAFTVVHIGVITVLSAFLFPRWMDPLVPGARREEGNRTYAPMVVLGVDDLRVVTGREAAFHEKPNGEIVNVLGGDESDGGSTADKVKVEKDGEEKDGEQILPPRQEKDRENGSFAAGMILK
jgi:hypothetical protein